MTQPEPGSIEAARAARERIRAQQGEPKQAKRGKNGTPEILTPLAALVPAAIEQSARRQSGRETPVATPWPAFNETLGGGMWAGLHVLCAGTGVGKTQLSLQLASHAAQRGTPVALVALELDEAGLALRLLAEQCRVSWSRAYHGRVSDSELERMRAAAEQVGKLPVYSDFGDAHGWPSLRLEHIARELRKRHPDGPALIVLDFLQLVASDSPESRVELRERIGVAAYRARNIARRYRVSVLVISSTARNNYDALNSKMSKAGLVTELRNGKRVRSVLYPDALIGTGKEAGEIEYAADSVTVLMRPVLTMGAHDVEIDGHREQGGKIIVAATVKVRAGGPSWFALAFHRGRFEPISEDACNSLGGTPEQAGPGRPTVDPLERVRRVVAAVANAEAAKESLASKTALRKATGGDATATGEAIETALRDGYIRYQPIEKRYVLGKPLPAADEQQSTNATQQENTDEQQRPEQEHLRF